MRTPAPSESKSRILIFQQYFTSLAEPGIARLSIFSGIWGRSGHSISIVTGMVNYFTGVKPEKYRGRAFKPEVGGPGVTIVRAFDSALGYRSYLGRLFSYLTFMISALWAGWSAPRPDTIIVSSPPLPTGLVGYLLGSLRRVPLVLEVRDLWPDVAIELGFVRGVAARKIGFFLERFMYARAALIVVVSPAMKSFLMREKGVPAGKIRLVPNPVDLPVTRSPGNDDLRRRPGLEDKFIVLYSGAFSAVYDFEMLLDVARELRDWEDLQFVLVGDGRQRPDLSRRIRRDHSTNVHLVPPVPKSEVYSLIRAADVCVATLKAVPMLRYSYATKIFDYMALGKPVVLAMEGESARLVIEEARCGIAVQPGHREAFREALMALYRDPARRTTLGQNGYRYAQKNLAAGMLAEKYLQILASVVAAGSPRRRVAL